MGIGPLRSSELDDEYGAAPLSDINVTPLVDVMLVLLIIFMVAAPLMTAGVPVQLPKMAAPKMKQPKKPIVISTDENGEPYLDKEPLLRETVVTRLKELAAQDPGQVVLVRGDRSVSYGRIIEIMGQISAAGFSKVSMIAQAPGEVLNSDI
ncbi:ExbD/TolR family protein [Microvirga roseola]|uniref:ExbD/TolR family protein n=1 Tax=Microvirga roseola TaxID=2883126 RepID=UPI001E605664|nr:biopolymer transporter ExbD [Microvirga roseola]